MPLRQDIDWTPLEAANVIVVYGPLYSGQLTAARLVAKKLGRQVHYAARVSHAFEDASNVVFSTSEPFVVDEARTRGFCVVDVADVFVPDGLVLATAAL